MQGLHDVRDRTAEFFSTVAALQKQHVLPSSAALTASQAAAATASPNRLFTNTVLPRSSSTTFPTSSSSHPLHHYDDSKDTAPLLTAANGGQATAADSTFNRAERAISSHLSLLNDQLARLARLVQKKSLFDDPTTEIEELVHVVKEGLEGVEADVSGLERLVKSGGKEEKDGGGGKHRETHSQVVVDNLRNNLKKKTVEFMDILQTRTKNMKEQNTRRKQFETNSSLPLRQRGVSRFDGLLEASTLSSSSAVDLEPPTADDPTSSHQQQQANQQLLAYEDPTTTDQYLASRAQATESIESTIHELSSMYGRLTSLVQQQEEVVVRIGENLDETSLNVERGHQELLKYFDGISGNRMLILKVFAILIAFLVFFMIFVA